jgi:hypothetical protein
MAPSADQFKALLASAIAGITSQRRREFLESKLISPYATRLHWEYGANEEFVAWVFADLGERDVVAQYCLGGHGARGFPWGINFRNDEYFGQDNGWYESLADLIADWGIEA